MAKILTKSDIKFDGVTVYRETTFNSDTGKDETKWYVNIGYKVQTVEGEEYNRDKQIELTGTKLTTVKNFFTTIKNQIKTEEGL